jgi:hypothetical protein
VSAPAAAGGAAFELSISLMGSKPDAEQVRKALEELKRTLPDDQYRELERQL